MHLIRHSRTRDLRVDFFRGLALWWIYTDHIPGDVMSHISLQNFAMCDATEIFVLLAGYGAGLAYGLEMNREGYLYAAADAVRRAWTLYIAHIFLFVIYTAQVAYSAEALDRAYYLDETRLDVLANAPYEGMLQALLLRFQPSLLNILPLYVMLLLIFAVTLPLLRRPLLLLGASFALYVVTRATGLNFQSWIAGEVWFFDPFAWQFLFMIGAVLIVRAAALAAGALAVRRAVRDHPDCWHRGYLGDRRASPAAGGDAGLGDPLRHHRGQDRPAPVPPAVDPVPDLAGRAHRAARRRVAGLAAGLAVRADGAEFAPGILFWHLFWFHCPSRAGI